MQAHRGVDNLSMDKPFFKIGIKVFEKKKINFCKKRQNFAKSLNKKDPIPYFHNTYFY